MGRLRVAPAWRARLLAFAAILAGVFVLVALLGRGDDYTVRVDFVDAGQLVDGSPVEIAGEPIGTVTKMDLTDDGQAEIELAITDPDYTPLPDGTSATIRTIGLSGVANRYVELDPGPDPDRTIDEGGVIDQSSTTPLVEIDELLSSLDPKVRADLQAVIQGAAAATDGTAPDLNETLAYLNPALVQGHDLAAEITRDSAAFERLLTSSADVVSALASRRDDVHEGVANAATALGAIASERGAVADFLARAPRTLGALHGTLTRVQHTIGVLRPAIREAEPVAAPLAEVLQLLPPTGRELTPLVTDVRELLPAVREGLAQVPALADSAVPTLQSTAKTITAAGPIFAGLRPYSPDIVAGLATSLGGVTGGYYDANGHYYRASLSEPGRAGASAALFGVSLPSLLGARTGEDARCPGGVAEPAADGSNPWIPDPSICDPEDDHR